MEQVSGGGGAQNQVTEAEETLGPWGQEMRNGTREVKEDGE